MFFFIMSVVHHKQSINNYGVQYLHNQVTGYTYSGRWNVLARSYEYWSNNFETDIGHVVIVVLTSVCKARAIS